MLSRLDNRIEVLPKEVADKIAAGEVIERPASIVKELVENSIDAGAENIIVEIEEGGKAFIRASDDGCGISKEELPIAIKRHATSKLRNPDDLFNLSTFGFRGEALPSIAAVSKMEIRSRLRTESDGLFLRLEEGNIVEEGAVGMSPGTIVTVIDLYYNVPARLKFLRSTATEEAHLIDSVCKIAINCPDIRFQLMKRNRQVFLAPKGEDRLTRIVLLYPNLKQDIFMAVNHKDETGMSLTGYITKPSKAKETKQSTTLFINGRVVRPGIISQAVMEGYRHFLPPKVYPPAFLFLEIPGDSVDVNVHPAKAEVRFSSPQKTFAFIQQAINNTLNKETDLLKTDLHYDESHANRYDYAPNKYSPATCNQLFISENRSMYGENKHKSIQETSYTHANLFEEFTMNNSRDTMLPVDQYNYNATITETATPIGEIANTYLIFQDRNNIYLVDQHQAHERSTFETLQKQIKEPQTTLQQPLLFPISISVSSVHLPLIEKHSELLSNLGFQLEPFGGNTILLRSIPHGLDKLSNQEALMAFLNDLLQYETIKEANSIRDKIITTIACKSSIKAGDSLTYEEKISLWKKLSLTENPYICPHGRPVMIKLSLNELHRLFKRK